MLLGLVSAIFPDLPLPALLDICATEGYDCVELMCWPHGPAVRRYAGVTHVDVGKLEKNRVLDLAAARGVAITGLGYYPNALTPDLSEREASIAHLRLVIEAARDLGVAVVNTFIGRDWTRSVEDNWPIFRTVWEDLVKFASDRGVRVAIENCPMLFTADEWPGGKNLAGSPAIWRRMFEEIPDPHFGLNYDPSHLIWQHMDEVRPLREFASRIHHVHAKDVRIDPEKLNDLGILAHPNSYHTPKLPGLGQVDWRRFFSELTAIGYHGPVCVEIEDRAYEHTRDSRILAARQAHTFLRQFVPKAGRS